MLPSFKWCGFDFELRACPALDSIDSSVGLPQVRRVGTDHWRSASTALSDPTTDNDFREALTAAIAFDGGPLVRSLKAEDVSWVVNDNRELGVRIGDKFFFLRDGKSFVYTSHTYGCGSPSLVRPVSEHDSFQAIDRTSGPGFEEMPPVQD